MTEAEIYAQMKAYILKTTLDPDTFLRKIDDEEAYDWSRANWRQAMLAGDQLKHLVVPPPPGGLAQHAQRVMFNAWGAGHAQLTASKSYPNVLHFTMALTADLHVSCSPDDNATVRAQKAAAYLAAAADAAAQWKKIPGCMVAAWGNQSQIGRGAIASFGAAISANYLIHQAESSAEYDDALADGASIIIGNANSWTDGQRKDGAARVNAGTLAYIHETYTNQGEPWPDASSSQGVPAAALSPGVGWGPYPFQLPAYQPHTPPSAWPTISPYLAEDFTTASWEVLP